MGEVDAQAHAEHKTEWSEYQSFYQNIPELI